MAKQHDDKWRIDTAIIHTAQKPCEKTGAVASAVVPAGYGRIRRNLLWSVREPDNGDVIAGFDITRVKDPRF